MPLARSEADSEGTTCGSSARGVVVTRMVRLPLQGGELPVMVEFLFGLEKSFFFTVQILGGTYYDTGGLSFFVLCPS